jgi:hypothetical protein
MLTEGENQTHLLILQKKFCIIAPFNAIHERGNTQQVVFPQQQQQQQQQHQQQQQQHQQRHFFLEKTEKVV